ncbi:MAG: GntR family transcriptional regulator [Deltaproteobacteria bacterium]|nr:GntR family transcriptional regulator [Deltaproteobacteria bacterium]
MAVDKEHIYTEIKNAILANELKPNTKLDERFLMKRFQISRTPLRDILLRLHNDGLIKIVPRMGTIVAPLELSDLREIVEMRKELEEFAVKLAIEKRNESHLHTLRQIIDGFGEAEENNRDLEVQTELDTRFHQTVYEAAHNKELTRCVDRMRTLMSRYWYNAGFNKKNMFSHFDSLRRVMNGIESRDFSLAQDAIQEHIEKFVSQLREIIS